MRTKVETTIGVVWAFFLRLSVLALVGYSIYRVRSILIAIVISAMLTYVALPAIDWLSCFGSRGRPSRTRRFWASSLIFVVLLGLTAVTIRYVAAPFIVEAQQIHTNFRTHTESFQKFSDKVSVWYDKLPADVQLQIEANRKKASDAAFRGLEIVLGSSVAWATHIIDIILIPVLAFYFAFDYRSLRREFVGMLPRSRRRESILLLRHIGGILQNYVVGQLILCVIAGVAVGFLLWSLSINYALALGVFAGVTRAIPIVGPIISGIVIVALGLLKAPIVGLYLLVFFCALHFVESKFILPKLIGHQMRLHPAVIIIVLLMGGEFFGLMGMFLAAPVAAIIRELVRFYVIMPRNREETDADNVITLTPPGVQSGTN